MSVKSSIAGKLEAAFSPERLEVINESHLHAGHHGHDGEGETHMRVRIVSAAFAGMGRVARHRAINDLVAAEFEAGLHALAVEAAAPGEPTRW
ncbi:BolA/IbaG family iron-sulfur metabolism protein [Shinella sp. AETb1-6]|uniref:BolA family protein n=1 Tax=Shinella sumterensis TaxID=1967501 RepID=A0AA50CNB3_9HYPH|nr:MULTISPECIES: BolA family protein [Shinella]MDP9589033.1 BolA protein [Shinella zoogloeoides]MXN52963.1 BolA/IbaG family iron-sulfur metabolism protein [Shinella sp. AETb1-6]WLR97406.1 BolA family protein [Shinella sumterensis]